MKKATATIWGLAMATSLTFNIQAATILWTSKAATVSSAYGATLDTGLFSSTGVVYAENTGGTAQAFDGINFTVGTIGFAGGGTANVFHEGGWPSQTAAYGSSGADSINLGTGSMPTLVIGQQYTVQLLVYDGRSLAAGRTVSVNGINQGVYGNGVFNVTWNAGLLLTGTFTADATTQAFTLETFQGSTSKGGLLNALVLNAIPEPSAALLGSLSSFALLRRRRERI